MKPIRLKLILGLPLLLCLLTLGCGPREKGPATRKIVSADGHFEITVPGGWKEEKSLNDSADLQASHRPSEMYIVVLSEPKADLDEMTLEGHSKLTRQALIDGVKKPQLSPAFAMKVGDMAALQYEIRGSMDGVNIVYLHTTAESPNYFHQILAWTVPSRFEKNKETLQKVIAMFREVPGSTAQ
ncbi:MAG TPA: hypothetical protein VJR29_09345 [bacterium]|nr:hypothetical protein [bacterium]